MCLLHQTILQNPLKIIQTFMFVASVYIIESFFVFPFCVIFDNFIFVKQNIFRINQLRGGA